VSLIFRNSAFVLEARRLELGDAWRWRKAFRALLVLGIRKCRQQGLAVDGQGRSETMDCGSRA
jgi:hypothetical protein